MDQAFEYWEEAIPDLGGICIEKGADNGHYDASNISDNALFAEPRSLESSELSESSNAKNESVWTAEEDILLIQEAKKNKNKWETVAKSFADSSPKSVEQRWKKIHTKIHKWTKEEDQLILSLYKTHGGNWKKISTFFTDVNSTHIKNHFYGTLKKKIETQNKLSESKEVLESKAKTIEELSAEDKRKKLQDLYQKMSEIETYINGAKTQIKDIVSMYTTTTQK